MRNNTFTVEIFNGTSKGPVEIFKGIRYTVVIGFLNDWLSNASMTSNLKTGAKISVIKEEDKNDQ